MKLIDLLSLSGCLAISLLQAQDPIVTARFANRNLHHQDGHYIVTTLNATPYIYTTQDSSIITSFASPLFLIIEDTTGTKHIPPISGLTVFPNPVHDVLILRREEWTEDYTIEIFSLHGIPFLKTKWPAGVSAFQWGAVSLPQGVFVVTVSSRDFSRRSQFKVLKS